MNPNIALGVQRPRFNTTQDQANALAIQNSRMQQQQNALAMQKAQADAARDTERRNALANAPTWKDRAAVELQYGDPKAALEIEKYLASQDAATRAAKLDEFKIFERAAPLLTSAETYDDGYRMLGELAPTIASRLPQQFTPDIVPNIERMAFGWQGWKEQQGRDATAKREEDRLAYDKQQDAARMRLDREKFDWQKTKPGQGFSVTTPDGTVVNYGSGGSVTNKTQGEAENRMIEAGDTIAALTNIRGQFKPTFQQIGTRAQMKLLALKDRAGTLNDDERAKLSEYATYRAEAGQLMSGMLNQLFGAAISEQEMKRGESFLPNTGTGLFDGDSPTEMDSKLKRYEDFTRKALMKAAYIQRNGMTVDQISIDQMPDLMRKRGNELSKEYANLPPNKMMQAVKARLADEFGLVAY